MVIAPFLSPGFLRGVQSPAQDTGTWNVSRERDSKTLPGQLLQGSATPKEKPGPALPPAQTCGDIGDKLLTRAGHRVLRKPSLALHVFNSKN